MSFLVPPLGDRVLTQNDSGNYFLTELHHGLDVINLETTATLKPNGSFDLHTPHKGAAKRVLQSRLMVRSFSSCSKLGLCPLPFPVERLRTELFLRVCWSMGRIEE